MVGQRQLNEEEESLITQAKLRKTNGRMSEREAMERRLANLGGDDPADAQLPPSNYTLLRERIAAQARGTRVDPPAPAPRARPAAAPVGGAAAADPRVARRWRASDRARTS